MENKDNQYIYNLLALIIVPLIIGYFTGSAVGESRRQTYIENGVKDCLEFDNGKHYAMVDCIYDAMQPPEPAPSED